MVKARHDRTNNVGPGGQLVKIDTFESRMRLMGHELVELGVDVPGIETHTRDVEEPIILRPEEHHKIGATEKNYVVLSEWQVQNHADPAVQVSNGVARGPRAWLIDCLGLDVHAAA